MAFAINPFESNPGWDLIKSVYDYYGLKDYIKFWYYERFSPEDIIEIEAYDFDNRQGDQLFWEKVLTGRILAGQNIRLKNFQVSSWFPRTPGQYWTFEAATARQYVYANHVEHIVQKGFVFDIWGKNIMTNLGGIGSVNFNKNRDFVMVTATASGMTDQGIPIVCRRNIWEKMEKEFEQGHKVEIDLDGTLVKITPDNSSFFLRTGSVPRVAILVNSLLNVSIKSSALKIQVCPWTIFKTKHQEKPYGFTYKTHDLFEENIINTNTWLKQYANDHGSQAILTDYDEDLNHLNAIFPLHDVAIGGIIDTEMISFLQNIHKAYDNN